ncbi:MAG: SDR family NAD(P)-dependent oxidoreductase [Syntrophales bacterium]
MKTVSSWQYRARLLSSEDEKAGHFMSSNKSIRIFNEATAIITGGASGIGRALSGELAKRGCEAVLADRQIRLAGEVASGIRASGGKASALEIDVTDYSAVERLVLETAERTGRLDYIVNNALGHNPCRKEFSTDSETVGD